MMVAGVICIQVETTLPAGVGGVQVVCVCVCGGY